MKTDNAAAHADTAIALGGRKESVLVAARRCFADLGYHSASIDAIAATAAVAKGTVYYHFDSKHRLFVAVVAEILRDLRSAIRPLLANDAPIERVISSILDVHVRYFMDSVHATTILLRGPARDTDSTVEHDVQQLRADYVAFVADALSMATESGLIHPIPEGLAASALLDLSLSACRYAHEQALPAGREQVARFLHTLVLTGLPLRPLVTGADSE